MTPWESTQQITTMITNQVAAVGCPGRCIIDRIAILRIASDPADSDSVMAPTDESVDVDVFNRAFTGPVITHCLILEPDPHGTGKCHLRTPLPLAVRVGDILDVDQSVNHAYNAAHRVLRVIDDYNVITDHIFTVSDWVTVQLAIPDAEQELYRVLPTMTGSDLVEATPGVTYVNQDPQLNLNNRGFPRLIYLRVASAGEYRVSLRVRQGVAQGD